MSLDAAERAADELRDLIATRTGITTRQQLQCPREKSDMTPCVARDGATAVAYLHRTVPICVGCEFLLAPLVEQERAKHA